MRNILHVIETGGPGGAETIYREIVTGLDPAKWRAHAAVPVADWLFRTLHADGVTPVLLETHGSFDMAYAARLALLARRSRAQLIHAHLLGASVYASAAGALVGIPVVCTFHGHVDVAADERYRGVKFRMIRRRANHVVFVSHALRREFLALGQLAAERTSVIHNGIDLSSFSSDTSSGFRAELGIADDELLLGAVGNVRHSKSYDVLLRAVALVRDRGVKCRAVIVGQTSGGGSLFSELRALQRELNLEETVLFTDFREDVPAVLRSLDLYVLSSRAEGFSLTTVQAMAAELPVIATRCGGPEEIVEDNQTGVLVAPDSANELADAIQRLAADPVRRAQLGRAARASVARRFSVREMLGNYERLYERCIAGAGA